MRQLPIDLRGGASKAKNFQPSIMWMFFKIYKGAKFQNSQWISTLCTLIVRLSPKLQTVMFGMQWKKT